jgi:GNAT superfamily N-acetyltransferase
MIKKQINSHDWGVTIKLRDTKHTKAAVGQVSLEIDGGIYRLEVYPHYREKGLATELLQEVEQLAVTKYNMTTVHLHCYDHRLSFYLDRGYCVVEKEHRAVNKLMKYLGDWNECLPL